MASSLFFSAYEKLLLLPCAPRREISSHGVDLPPCHVPHPRLSLSPLLSVRLPMPPILLASPLLLGYIVVRVSYESCIPLILIVVLRALVVVAPRREASWNHRAS